MPDKEEAKQQIRELVGKYNRIAASSEDKKYNEERTKNEFIEPLFETLGWDVRNKKVYDEFIKEEKILKGRVDYAIRLNGVNKFFIEAKPLKADLDDPSYAKQAIEYGFNKAVGFVVLTDFERLKVFSSEWNETNVWRSIVFELKCAQYETEIDKLWLLSRDSIEKGLLSEYTKSIGKRTPRGNVQELLSQELISWRKRIADDIKSKYGTKYEEHEVDDITQKLIDRLIFIRTCEDRELEGKQLREATTAYDKGDNRLHSLLKGIFSYYRREYDSSLFGKDEGDLREVDQVEISDKVLYDIINSTYYSKDGNIGYNFGDIEADILGNAYEQYLGYVLSTTAKRAKAEYKLARRKEQGIYYTPKYIVDYIVRSTVGELIKDKTPEEVDKIRILDPACGSGSFLIRAFDELHNYAALKERSRQETLSDFELKRTTKILKNNIFGVDLDEKAVEIAQLNLMLKAAEKRQRLPLLQDNIKCGDSLIDDDKVAGEKAFKWEERFKQVADEGGFDIVIGNPPYVNMQTLPQLQKYCEIRYPEIYSGQNDLLYYFILRGLNVLKTKGKLGFIVSRYFLESKYASKFRKFILVNSAIDTIIDFNNFQVFGRDVNVLTSIILLRRENRANQKRNMIKVIKVKNWDKSGLELMAHIVKNSNKIEYSDDCIDLFRISQDVLDEQTWALSNPIIAKIKRKIRGDSKLLSSICDIGQGMTTGLNEAFIVDSQTAEHEKIEQPILRNYVKTRDLKKYFPLVRGLKVIYLPEKMDENRIKYALKHLEKYQSQLKKRFDYKKRHCEWYSWGNLRNRKLFEKNSEKILTPLYSTANKFVYDSGKPEHNYYTLTDTYIIVKKEECGIDLKYILALLNSKLIEFYFKNTAKLKRGGYYEYSGGSLSKIPIRYDGKVASKIISIMNSILLLNKRLSEIGDKKTDERVQLEERIEKMDAEINELVYETYGITEGEKKVIADNLK